MRKTNTCCQTLLDTRESAQLRHLIDARTVGKAPVRVCALSGTQVSPSRDASLLKARLCKFCSSQSCLFAFLCQAGRGQAGRRSLAEVLAKGLVLVFEDRTKSSIGTAAPKPAFGIVEMSFLRESLQIISSAARWYKLARPWGH